MITMTRTECEEAERGADRPDGETAVAQHAEVEQRRFGSGALRGVRLVHGLPDGTVYAFARRTCRATNHTMPHSPTSIAPHTIGFDGAYDSMFVNPNIRPSLRRL